MIFAAPIPFEQAQQAHAVRTLLGTELSSAQMKEVLRRLPESIRRRFFFMSRVDNYQTLERLRTIIAQLGDINTAKGRELAREFLAETGYQPAPGTEDTIRDLRTRRRLDLVIDSNLQQTDGFAHFAQRQNADVLLAFPALELVREFARDLPRGSPEYRGPASIGWPQRWLMAAQMSGDLDAARVLNETQRMVALSDSRIWDVLGSEWEDSLGSPHDPLAWGTGMRQRPVGRRDAIALGLIEPDETVQPRSIPDFNAALEQPVEVRDQEMFDALQRTLASDPELANVVFEDGVLKLK